MKIVIEIPKEFERDYNKDKFNEFFERLKADFPNYLDSNVVSMSGNYEKETLQMLEKAFKESNEHLD